MNTSTQSERTHFFGDQELFLFFLGRIEEITGLFGKSEKTKRLYAFAKKRLRSNLLKHAINVLLREANFFSPDVYESPFFDGIDECISCLRIYIGDVKDRNQGCLIVWSTHA